MQNINQVGLSAEGASKNVFVFLLAVTGQNKVSVVQLKNSEI
jgi:hypothetical protein